MKILVIDDDPFVLKLIGHQMTDLGFTEVSLHDRGEDALALLKSGCEQVGLVICDLQMPEMDGVEFVRHLADIGYAGGLVLVSGEDERILQTAQTLARTHRLNVLGTLHKPFTLDRLRKVMERHSSPGAVRESASPKTYGPGELKRAIGNGELVNWYQPKVAIASRDVTGVEALVRWRHPRDGWVFPDQFITAAEEHRLIDDLTLAVLTSALSLNRRWQASGISLHIAVNVSMDNLTSLDFPERLASMAKEMNAPLTNLVLEVTETRLMKDPLASLDILTRLRLKGIGLSIDDFGTNYSSLAQLRDIPFTELKVDRGFVHGADRNESARAIFEGSLVIARQLGLKTVAEGVEDQADWDFLRAAGCDLAQGYFIARPMPEADLAAWLASWDARHRELEKTGP